MFFRTIFLNTVLKVLFYSIFKHTNTLILTGPLLITVLSCTGKVLTLYKHVYYYHYRKTIDRKSLNKVTDIHGSSTGQASLNTAVTGNTWMFFNASNATLWSASFPLAITTSDFISSEPNETVPMYPPVAFSDLYDGIGKSFFWQYSCSIFLYDINLSLHHASFIGTVQVIKSGNKEKTVYSINI